MSGPAAGLQRGMGLRTVTSTSTGLAFAAIEYLAAAGLLVYVAGSLAWVAVLVAGLLALLAWVSSVSSAASSPPPPRSGSTWRARWTTASRCR